MHCRKMFDDFILARFILLLDDASGQFESFSHLCLATIYFWLCGVCGCKALYWNIRVAVTASDY